jgi:hypothetical protein
VITLLQRQLDLVVLMELHRSGVAGQAMTRCTNQLLENNNKILENSKIKTYFNQPATTRSPSTTEVQFF